MKKEDIMQAGFILAITFLLAIGASWISGKFKPTVVTIPPENLRSVVECPRDFASYEATKEDKNIVLLQYAPSYAQEGKFIKEYNFSIKRSGLNSQIACGYLFYRISVGDEPIVQAYENLYLTPTNRQFGGHIIPEEKSVIRNEDVNGKTEILMPLDSISYDGTQRKNIMTADWASLLNVSDRIDFTAALNTTRGLGRIDSLEIAYKCWNPKTGEETQDCKLEILK